MRVTADVFSGRPNPEWTLDEREAEEVGTLFRALGEARGAAPEPPGLGYRGFVVAGGEARLDGCGEVRAFQGHVTARCGGAARLLADGERRLERRLLESAGRHLDPELATTLREVAGM